MWRLPLLPAAIQARIHEALITSQPILQQNTLLSHHDAEERRWPRAFGDQASHSYSSGFVFIGYVRSTPPAGMWCVSVLPPPPLSIPIPSHSLLSQTLSIYEHLEDEGDTKCILHEGLYSTIAHIWTLHRS